MSLAPTLEPPTPPAPPRADLFAEIARLKREMNAIILAHYYQEPDIQDVADYVEDSLGLARRAASVPCDAIVFAGVHFMAETAKILNPEKPVYVPDLDAGCSLADSCPAPAFARFKAENPDHLVVTYINSSAAVKALSDIICTSTNAVAIFEQIPIEQPVIFAPDKNLGAYLAKKTGRKMKLWNGTCIVHELFSERKLVQLRALHPGVPVLAHPECAEPVLRHADFIGSTSQIIAEAARNPARKFIVATEAGIIHAMEKAAPGKSFIPAPPTNSCACNECPHMKKNTLEKLYLCLRDRRPELVMDPALREQARKPLDRMLEMSKAVPSGGAAAR